MAVLAFVVAPGAARADEAIAVRPLFTDPAQLASWLAVHDPKIAAAQAKREAAVAARAQAGVLPNPQLQFAVGGLLLGRSNPPGLGLDDTTNYNIGLSELVELGKRGPRQRAASLRVDAAGEQTVDALGDRLGDAITTLGKLTYVISRRAAMAANLESARKLQTLEQVRRDHADLSGAEFSRIELDTQQLELQLSRATADVATALAACGALLHAPCSTDGITEPTSLDAGAPLPGQLPASPAAIDAAIEGKAERVAARLEINALESDARLAEHRAIPDLTIGLGYTFDNLVLAGNQPKVGQVSIAFPLPFFDHGDHDAEAARANARAAAAEDQASALVAHGEVEALTAQRQTLEATLKTLETTAVPKSAQIVEQTRHAFDLGQAGLAELLLAERAHRELQLEVLDTRFDLFNVRAQLRQALGLDDQTARAARRSS